jgi:hypothetical protein
MLCFITVDQNLGFFVFLVLDESRAALTLLLPMDCVGYCALRSATDLGCWLVVEQTTSRTEEALTYG